MDSDLPDVPVTPSALNTRIWPMYRRPAFLLSLVTGVILLLIWLPSTARTALLAALRAQRALVGMILLFTVIALSLVWSAGQRLDTWAFLLFNIRGYHPRWLDRAVGLATQVGNMVTAFLLAGLLFLRDYRRVAVEVIFGTLTLWLLVEIVKTLTDRARPFLEVQGTRIIGWRERGRSFPSGHTAQTFFLATLLHHRFQMGVEASIAMYSVAALVGFTRMYVGAHYPRDVIGGAVLGCAWGVLATLVDRYWLGLWF